jgi:hypothetical protein
MISRGVSLYHSPAVSLTQERIFYLQPEYQSSYIRIQGLKYRKQFVRDHTKHKCQCGEF